MKKTKKAKKRKLRAKLLWGVVLSTLIPMILTALVVGYYLLSAEYSEITENAFATTRAGARMVDGDRVLSYLDVVSTDENGNPVYYTDDYYYEVLDFLNAIQEENDLVLYYYIFVPKGDTVVYVWDATTSKEPSPRGFTEERTPSEKESTDLAFSRTPEEKIALILDSQWGDLLTGFSPIYNSSGEPVALVGIDLSLRSLLIKINVYMALIMISLLIMTVVIVLFILRSTRKLVINPIEKLNGAVKSIVGELSGRTRFDLEINTGDELEELADSFRSMDDDIHTYIDQLTNATADRERINTELGIAQKIQADILPNEFPAFPDRKEFDIYAALYPCKDIGGNFYDFFLIDEDHLAMIVGDVSGSGVPSALYMVMVQTLIKSRAMQSFTPADVLQSVSDQMLEHKTELSSIVWVAMLELSTGKGIAVNAGYGAPVLRRAGKRFELQEYENFPPVGSSESVRFRDHGFRLDPGDTVFIFSDGIRNARNDKGETFGSQRVLEYLNREPEATPSVLVQTVKQAVDRFSADEDPEDDHTMLAMKYYGPDGSRPADTIGPA